MLSIKYIFFFIYSSWTWSNKKKIVYELDKYFKIVVCVQFVFPITLTLYGIFWIIYLSLTDTSDHCLVLYLKNVDKIRECYMMSK